MGIKFFQAADINQLQEQVDEWCQLKDLTPIKYIAISEIMIDNMYSITAAIVYG